jgi:biotin carboxylase
MKRLLVLGAGPFQLRGICKAKELGHEVITLDYLPDNVGHKYSHACVICSTTDREGVLKAAMELSIDGICTFSSDVAIPTVGYVCEFLGLPGVSVNAAEIMAAKDRFRAFLAREGLSHPRFTSGTMLDDIIGDFCRLCPPVLFKPIDTSGSRGVIRIDNFTEDTVEHAFNYAKSFSRSGRVCVEEFINGVEVGGDGILIDGRFAFIAITHKHLNGYVVTGHSLPTNINDTEQAHVIKQLENCCRALGYFNGPLNFDVIVGSDRVIVLEMSARNGGNGLPAVIQRSIGVDVEQSAIHMALGMKPDLTSHVKPRGSGSLVFGHPDSGVLRHISSRDSIMAEIPEVFDLYLTVEPGDLVAPFEHNGNMLGYALFDCKDSKAYNDIAQRITDTLSIVVK